MNLAAAVPTFKRIINRVGTALNLEIYFKLNKLTFGLCPP